MSVRAVEVGGVAGKIIALPAGTPHAVEAFRTFLHSDARSIYGLDVETTAIDQVLGPFERGAAMRLIQFGSYTRAWVLDPHDEFWRPYIVRALRNRKRRFVSHTNYDPLWVHREFDIELGERAIDTRVMSRLLMPHRPGGHDLKNLCDQYIDTGLSEAEASLNAHFKACAPVGQRAGDKAPKAWGFTNIPIDDPLFTLYAGLDAIYVRHLLDKLNARVRPQTRKLARREQQIARIGTAIRERGHRIDYERTEAMFRETDAAWSEADDRLRARLGFTPRSYAKRNAWLIERGVRFFLFTDTGAPSITKDTLPALATIYADTPEVGDTFRDLLVLSKHNNLRTNLSIALAQADESGFVHPQINTLAAVTGRMSIVKPAMQTFKKSDPRLRGCFLARPGHVLVGADYDSQEIRLAVAYSRDPALTRILREGLNQHDETARLIFGKHFTPEQRSQAKVLNFAQQYGAGPRKIGDQLGMPRINGDEANPQARSLWQAWRMAYSGLVEWTDRMAELPVVENPWGRRIPRDRYRHYANGNYMIQSSGRDVLGDAMVRLADLGWDRYIWLPIHDELVLEVPEELADEAVDILSSSMFAVVRGVELTATAKVLGDRWSGD